MSFSIRPATSSDAQLLHQLVLELAEYEKLLDEARAGSDPDALHRHLAAGATPPLLGFIAEMTDGEGAGFALCYHQYSTFHTNWGLYLEDLYVRPRHRGRGIGLGLMRAVAALALSRGCVRLEWQVLDWNAPAIEFYDRIGARRMADWLTMRLTGPALQELAS